MTDDRAPPAGAPYRDGVVDTPLIGGDAAAEDGGEALGNQAQVLHQLGGDRLAGSGAVVEQHGRRGPRLLERAARRRDRAVPRDEHVHAVTAHAQRGRALHHRDAYGGGQLGRYGRVPQPRQCEQPLTDGACIDGEDALVRHVCRRHEGGGAQQPGAGHRDTAHLERRQQQRKPEQCDLNQEDRGGDQAPRACPAHPWLHSRRAARVTAPPR